MPLTSSKVAAGTEILADHVNKLREDMLTNHDHSSGKGGTIDHSDLAETDEMAGMGHQHGDIDVHLLGSGPGPNSIDNPGGDQGVHGHSASVYVAGSVDYNGTAKQMVFRCGTGTIVQKGGLQDQGFTVNFAPVWSSVLGATATCTDQSTAGQKIRVTSLTTSVMEIRADWELANKLCYWLAWGTM